MSVGSRAAPPPCSCLGCLGPVGGLRGRWGDNKMDNNFSAAERAHVSAGRSLPGCPLSETRLAKHTILLFITPNQAISLLHST